MNAISSGVVHKVPDDLYKALTSNPKALTLWESLTPLARNEWICWVIFVKRDETRKNHVNRTINELRDGKKRPCCWMGCVHRNNNANLISMQKGFTAVPIILLALLAGVIGVFAFNHRPGDNPIEKSLTNRLDSFQNIKVTEKFEVFPAKLEDFQVPPKMYGLWPYGIKGNDSNSHNEGHPGWDLELTKGSKVYAIGDLMIGQIHDGDKITPEGSKLLVIEAQARLKDGDYHIVYHSVKNLEKEVVEGANIKAGSPLAEVGYPLSEESAMIHFGIFAPNDSIGSCPTRYFADELLETINKITANSFDSNTGKPYSSACVGKINKVLYYKNFPDRVKYLRGNEEWE